MQKTKKKLSIFIGRMSPFHNGHASDLDYISKNSDHMLVLVGSSYRARSLKNPFTFLERRDVIEKYLENRSKIPYGIRAIEDNPYNDNEWIASVQRIVREYREQFCPGYEIEIVASDKESTDSYPHWFPGFKKRIIPAYRDSTGNIMAATDIRDSYFSSGLEFRDIEFIAHGAMPEQTLDFLEKFYYTDAYRNLVEEYEFIRKYKKEWENTPYPVNFVTTDAVVVQSGHVLLIQRKDNPGKDQWAIPGGFLNINERLIDGVVRELIEETQIKVPEKILRKAIIDHEYFDNPGRSDRGRILTHAFYFKLDDSLDLPHIKGADDAKKAQWVPISELYGMRAQFFDDHWFIIKNFLKI